MIELLNGNELTEVESVAYSTAFELVCALDEARTSAARLQAAAHRTTGLERESNVRQAAWAEAEVERLEAELKGGHASAKAAPTEAHEPVAAPMSRQRHQEAEILHVLREMQYDAQRLPRSPAGTPGPKAEVRSRLSHMTPKVFDKAWDRLRGNGEISDVG
jgi:hypothetical protein